MNAQEVLQQIREWFINNKTWLFSGVGVAIISAIVGIVVNRKKHTKQQPKIENSITINDNKEAPISFNGANFGVITNKEQDDKHKKAD